MQHHFLNCTANTDVISIIIIKKKSPLCLSHITTWVAQNPKVRNAYQRANVILKEWVDQTGDEIPLVEQMMSKNYDSVCSTESH